MGEKSKLNCYAFVIQLMYQIIGEEVYVNFNFCCDNQYNLMKYKFDEVCEDFDKYYEKALQIAKERKICDKCTRYDGTPIDAEHIGLNNGLSLVCSQGCKFCFAKYYMNRTLSQFPKPKLSMDLNKKFLQSVSKSKKLIHLTVSCQGEPFEDPYIRNTFLFNLHNTSIKHINFLTNAVHATKDYIDKLFKYFEENDIRATFLINIAGFTKDIYESYCTGKFEKVISNIENLSKTFGKDNITILYIISKHNYFIKKPEVIEQFKKAFPYLDPDKHLRIIMDWKNWKDSERIKLNGEFCDTSDKSVDYKLKKYITDSFLPKIQEWRQ